MTIPVRDFRDKFTRNELVTSNELRGIIGLRLSSGPEADKLCNKNLNKTSEDPANQQKGVTNDNTSS